MYNQNREAKALFSRLKAIAFMCEHYEKTKEKRRFEKREPDKKNYLNNQIYLPIVADNEK